MKSSKVFFVIRESRVVPAGWIGELAESLGGFGVPFVADYPVAGWSVDLAVGEPDSRPRGIGGRLD